MSSDIEKKLSWITTLPKACGRFTANASLAKFSWFRCGGPAEILFQPKSVDGLIQFMNLKPPNTAITVIGGASNLLIRDGGVPGVTIKLGKSFSHISISDLQISVGAGVNNVKVARKARNAGISGLEFLIGIPGSVGGSLKMNAGAYGREIADIVMSVRAIDKNGEICSLSRQALNFSYRNCQIPDGWVFIDAMFLGKQGTPKSVELLMKKIELARETSQPTRARTSGSTFVNPQNIPAWKLIEAAGCRGLRRGGAMVSKKHSNFLVNVGDATATDLENLGEDVRSRVWKYSGINLEWEIKRVGISSPVKCTGVK